jgi:2-octaprenyl-6-methoxyphenol hydroxylase
MESTDILVAGGGIAGLSAAARLGAEGRSVVLVDPAPPDSPGRAGGGDLRTTAFLQPSVATLTRAGAWAAMQEAGAALRVMRIVDAGGRVRRPRATADFTADSTAGSTARSTEVETGHGLFGWNVPNRAARSALLDRLGAMPNVSLRQGASVEGYLARLDAALVRLSDGSTLRAALVVAADGRESTLRRLAGIGHRRWGYGQKALVFAVTHLDPHDGVSTEIHRTGGPLTLVPMPDHDGRPCSSVVWMAPGQRAAALAAMDDDALGAEITAETMGLFGPLRVASPRAVWPIIAQVATRLTAPRLALIAEAAHVVPPIGAQGLNMSLADVEALARTIENAPDPGDPGYLASYARRQMPAILARVAGVDLLNRAARAEAQPLRDLRGLGLAAIDRIGPLRRLAIRAGLGG